MAYRPLPGDTPPMSDSLRSADLRVWKIRQRQVIFSWFIFFWEESTTHRATSKPADGQHGTYSAHYRTSPWIPGMIPKLFFRLKRGFQISSTSFPARSVKLSETTETPMITQVPSMFTGISAGSPTPNLDRSDKSNFQHLSSASFE